LVTNAGPSAAAVGVRVCRSYQYEKVTKAIKVKVPIFPVILSDGEEGFRWKPGFIKFFLSGSPQYIA
jgi:hypothetical protein